MTITRSLRGQNPAYTPASDVLFWKFADPIMPRFRFSIRALLLLTTIAAVVAWWTASPTITASQFIYAVNNREFERAGSMFLVEGPNAMLIEGLEWRPAAPTLAWTPKLTIRELLRGRRRVELSVTYEGPTEERTGYFPLEASYLGIHAQPTGRDFKFH